jgi:hypothetical protein
VFRRGVIAALIIWSACGIPAGAQQADSLLLKNDPYLAELDSLLAVSDSTQLLSFIDSLINLPDYTVKSQLIARIGYNSNVVADSRTLGFNQFGIAPGVSYYHKSGMYADLTTYWSKEYDPNFYLTVGSAGYMNSPTKWWSFMAEYSRYMYSDTSDDIYIAYKNNVGVSNFFDVKPFTFRLDYQFYFGDKEAHRITPSVMLNLQKRDLGKITRISFYPTISVMLGSEQITEYLPYSNTLIGALMRQRRGLPLYYEETNTEFGILNYSFVAPISINLKNWFFILSYTYNIPKALPGETLTLENSGYLSASVSRRIQF